MTTIGEQVGKAQGRADDDLKNTQDTIQPTEGGWWYVGDRH